MIKLSQFSQRLEKIHYTAVKHVFQYLRDIINHRIHYWRPEERPDCDIITLPEVTPDNHALEQISQIDVTAPYLYVDSDWIGGINTIKSVTGLDLMLVGGSVAYTSKSQVTIAHSTSLV